MKHFGARLHEKGLSFYLNREEFALINTKPSLPWSKYLAKENAYTDESTPLVYEYRQEWCEEYRKLCLENYDLNISYFNSLDFGDFNYETQKFLLRYKGFHEIDSLQDYNGIEGFYLLILDKYKQVYIGETIDIKRRIQQHWSKRKEFDRILFPMYAVKESCFSIDFFRALDTTRIFVWEKQLDFDTEAKLVSSFPQKYTTNRIGGNISTAIEALATLHKRNL